MRRREKFVIASVVLTLGLAAVQYVPLDFRYISVAAFVCVSYLVSSWVLSDDLQFHERFTIVPLPAVYAAAVSLFYFLLPESLISRVIVLALFGVGMYALFLTANIFSVAKGRTIQLVHAANAVSGLFGVFISLLLANTIFSLKLHFIFNGMLIGITHFPLLFMLLWSTRLESSLDQESGVFAMILSLILAEFAMVLSFFPLSVWYMSLFVMSIFYIGFGLLQSYLRNRLFFRTLFEYSLVASFVVVVFLAVLPLK